MYLHSKKDVISSQENHIAVEVGPPHKRSSLIFLRGGMEPYSVELFPAETGGGTAPNKQ